MSVDPISFLLSIFSGIGNKIFEKKELPQPVKIENTIQLLDANKKDELDDNTEVAGIVKRLNEFKELINANRNYDRFTIAKLAKIMGFSSVGELENVFLGKTEPNFEFINKFCSTFGLNEEWLSEGKGFPFRLNKQTHFSPYHYYGYIKEVNPETIYFIRVENSESSGYTFIILRFSDWKYEIIHRLWHIGSGTGSGGKSQIYGMYKLLKVLDKDEKVYISGRILNKKDFDLLYSGKVFPSSILDYPKQSNMWWDDFTDVYNKYSTKEFYERNYGSGFLVAQNVVKMYLKQEHNPT